MPAKIKGLSSDESSTKGEMFVFSTNPWEKLVGFKVGNAPRAAILIGGQGDGFMALNYIDQLTKQLIAEGWSVIQALFTSWYAGYRTSVLETDSEDLNLLLTYCMQNFEMEEFVLLGFHTGAQDVVYYMQQGEHADKITRVVLQGGMRDPQTFGEHDPATEETNRMIAQEMIEMERGNNLLPKTVHPRPISAFRYLALDGNQGVQDFFNPNLTDDEMAQIVGHIECPVLVVFCMDENYRMCYQDKQELKDKIQNAIPGDVTCEWIQGGCDEWLNFLCGSEGKLASCVGNFLTQEQTKRQEKVEERKREQEAEAKRGRSVVHKNPNLKRSISQSSLGSSQFSSASGA